MNNVQVERLRGRENYEDWKIAIKAFLLYEDLWDGVIEIKEENAVSVNAEKDRKAHARIMLLIDPVCYVHTKGVTTARDLWTKLKLAYEDTGLFRKVGLLRKLIRSNLSDCGTMDKYVNEVISTAHCLNNIGFPISDEWLGTLLLAGLPESYRPMILGLESSGIEIKADMIKVKLLQETPEVEDVALLSQQRGCFGCGDMTHKLKNCPKKRRNTKKYQPRGKKGDAFSVVLSTMDIRDDEQNCFFDSACTSYYTHAWTLVDWPKNRKAKWTLVDLPKGRKANSCKWNFKLKEDVTGQVVSHKARLVCKSYAQRKGEDYDQTYAPVVCYCTLRYLFGLAALNDISYAVNIWSRYSANANSSHWTVVKHLLRCLKETGSMRLEYSRDSVNTELLGYSRDSILQKNVSILHIGTEDQIADSITKPLPRVKLEDHREKMGLMFIN